MGYSIQSEREIVFNLELHRVRLWNMVNRCNPNNLIDVEWVAMADYSREALDRMFEPMKCPDDPKLAALLKAVFDLLLYRMDDDLRKWPCIGALETAYKEYTGFDEVPVNT